MGDVISINQPRKGDKKFVSCGCKPEGTDYIVVAMIDKAPLIICLVCPECNKEISVTNGFINIEANHIGD